MLYVFIAGLLWGTIGVFVNELNALGVSSSLISLMRMFFAFLVMLIIAFIKNGRKIFSPGTKTIFLCILLGIVSHGFFNLFYTSSISMNGMGTASILLYTAPVFTALASRIIFHEKLTGRKIFALALNIAGCVLTVTGGKIHADTLKITGILCGLGSGFCYGMAAIIGRKAQDYTDAFTLSAYSYLSAVIFLIIFMRPEISGAAENLNILCWGFLFGIIPTALAYVIYYIGLLKISDTSKVPVIASIEPVIAVIIGTQFYGESIGLLNYAGIAVVLISIIIMMKSES